MSLPVAERGAKAHLRHLWEADSFVLEQACRDEGRNDAFWAYCFWLQRRGEELPSGAALRGLTRRCNLATGYRNVLGQDERYTRHEAQETVKQVSRYARAHGLAPLVRRLRKRRRQDSPRMHVLACALADVAERSSSTEFTASYRQLSEMTGIPLIKIGATWRELERARRVWRIGFTRALPGRASGTTRWSIKPPRPRQNIDEVCPPTYDARRMRWTWPRPEDRGVLSSYAFTRMIAGAARSLRGSVPNVLITPHQPDLEGSTIGSERSTGPPRAFRSS